MRIRNIGLRAGLLAAANLFIAATSEAHEPATPLAVFGRLPFLEDVALSPDGTRLAFVRTTQNDRALLVMTLGKTGSNGARVGDSKLRSIQWQDNNRVMAIVSSTSLPPMGIIGPKQDWQNLVRFDVNKGKSTVFDFEGSGYESLNVVLDNPVVRQINNKSVLFVEGLYVGPDEVLPGLFRFEDGADTKLLARASVGGTEWLVDEEGRPIVQLEYQDSKKTWTLKSHVENRWATIASGTAAIDNPHILGFDYTGKQVVISFVENGVAVWRQVSLKDGTIQKTLDAENALRNIIVDPRNDRVIGGVSSRDSRKYIFFDNELQAHWDAVLREFPDEVVHLVSHNEDFSRMVIEVFGAKDGYVYAMYDWYSHKAVILGKIYDGLQQISEVKPITYKAADGMSISGFLTLPAGLEAKKLPLIVFPHGGPASYDTNDFDWWAQAMADQGYAVLQPNYRGSTLDAELKAAGYGEFGRKMQTDLSDGVRYLAADGLVDPKRVCIVGASYGGYAALAGVTLQRGVYRCSVSVAGISDLHRMRNDERRDSPSSATRFWDRYWGVSSKDEAQVLKEISPIDHVQSIEVPVLLIHGKDDTTVPFEQSEVMLNAMKKAGKQVELIALKHEDHYLSRSETRLQMLEATVAFLRANNPPN
jgi:dipeptidyl aminopeptidase/acylaminoacyl peptidase